MFQNCHRVSCTSSCIRSCVRSFTVCSKIPLPVIPNADYQAVWSNAKPVFVIKLNLRWRDASGCECCASSERRECGAFQRYLDVRDCFLCITAARFSAFRVSEDYAIVGGLVPAWRNHSFFCALCLSSTCCFCDFPALEYAINDDFDITSPRDGPKEVWSIQSVTKPELS